MPRKRKSTKTGAPSKKAGRRQYIEETLSRIERSVREELTREGLSAAESMSIDETIAAGNQHHLKIWFASTPPKTTARRIEDLIDALVNIRDCRLALAAADPWTVAVTISDAIGHWLAGPAFQGLSSRKGAKAGGESKSQIERDVDYAREHLERPKSNPRLSKEACARIIIGRDGLSQRPNSIVKAINRGLAHLKK